MNAEKIADKARKSISRYCYEECKAYCCRRGYLILRDKETNRVTQKNAERLIANETLKKLGNGNHSLKLSPAGCPSLRDFKCTIHKSKNRPLICRQFPIFIDGNVVKLSSRCPAIKDGKLYPFIKRLSMMGFEVVEGNIMADSDCYDVSIAKN